jgi:hypothetical protein
MTDILYHIINDVKEQYVTLNRFRGMQEGAIWYSPSSIAKINEVTLL